MPAQFDRLADSESHRQVGTTVGRAASSLRRRRRRRTAFAGAALLLAAGAVVAFAVPSALAGSSDRQGTVTSTKPAVKAKPVTKAKAKAKAKPVAKAKADTAPTSKPTPSSKPTPTSKPTPAAKAVLEPVPATESSYAENIPAYPPDGRHGRRIVYSKALMHVWLVNSDDEVVRDYPVTGRWDRPAKGTYHVYSMSSDTMNEHSMVTFQWMVRFAWGTNDTSASIGFHSIPTYYKDNPERGAKKGDRMTGKDELGLPVASGGCVRQSDEDAEFLYRWAEIDDLVVVLPTAD